MMTLNLNDSSLIFTRIGSKELLYFRQFPDTVIKRVAPKSFKFVLENSIYRKIETIPFQEKDLIDLKREVDDGIYINILFNRNNGGIIDIDINNATTNNQNIMIIE